VLAAHLKRDLLEGGCRALGDERSDGAGAGEADGADIGMLDQCRTGGRTGAANDVDDSRRKACFNERLDEVVGRVRRVSSRLDNACVAGNERGKELPAGNGHGEVPRGDETDDAQGHPDGHGELVLELGGGCDAKEPTALASHVKGLVDGFLHVAASLGEYFAHLTSHLAGVFLFVLGEIVACTEQDFSPLGSGNQPPGGEGLLSGGYGKGHVFGVGGGKSANDVGVV